MAARNFHEDLARHGDEPRASERNLGVTFAVVLALIAALKFYRGDAAAVYWIAAAAVFLACAYLWTAPLRPLNLVWHRLGLILFAVVSPIVMGVVFYTTVAPIGLLMRSTGKDPLRLKFDRAARSYWIERDPPGPAGEQMKNQF
jgi:saxitoxin biosynthesis operon SxtJ-like protein